MAFGAKVGGFIDWDSSNEGSWERFMRFRTCVDLTNQLKRGSMICDSKGKSVDVFFKYERTLDFCYICGWMGHVIRDCSEKDNKDYKDEEIHSKEMRYIGKEGWWYTVVCTLTNSQFDLELVLSNGPLWTGSNAKRFGPFRFAGFFTKTKTAHLGPRATFFCLY